VIFSLIHLLKLGCPLLAVAGRPEESSGEAVSPLAAMKALSAAMMARMTGGKGDGTDVTWRMGEYL
jgi:hypothetical protein